MKVKYIFKGAFRWKNYKLVCGKEYDIDRSIFDLFPERFELIEQAKPKKAKKEEVQDGDTECE